MSVTGISDPLGLIADKSASTAAAPAEDSAPSTASNAAPAPVTAESGEDAYLSALLSTNSPPSSGTALNQSAKGFCDSCQKATQMSGDNAMAELGKQLEQLSKIVDSQANQNASALRPSNQSTLTTPQSATSNPSTRSESYFPKAPANPKKTTPESQPSEPRSSSSQRFSNQPPILRQATAQNKSTALQQAPDSAKSTIAKPTTPKTNLSLSTPTTRSQSLNKPLGTNLNSNLNSANLKNTNLTATQNPLMSVKNSNPSNPSEKLSVMPNKLATGLEKIQSFVGKLNFLNVQKIFKAPIFNAGMLFVPKQTVLFFSTIVSKISFRFESVIVLLNATTKSLVSKTLHRLEQWMTGFSKSVSKNLMILIPKTQIQQMLSSVKRVFEQLKKDVLLKFKMLIGVENLEARLLALSKRIADKLLFWKKRLRRKTELLNDEESQSEEDETVLQDISVKLVRRRRRLFRFRRS